MANFETLKTAIDANINTNGKQAITGSVVNNVMHQMVDATSEQLTELESKVGIAFNSSEEGIPNIDTTNKVLDLGEDPVLLIGQTYYAFKEIFPDNPEYYRAIPFYEDGNKTGAIKLVFDLSSKRIFSLGATKELSDVQMVIGGFRLLYNTHAFVSANLPFDYKVDGKRFLQNDVETLELRKKSFVYELIGKDKDAVFAKLKLKQGIPYIISAPELWDVSELMSNTFFSVGYYNGDYNDVIHIDGKFAHTYKRAYIYTQNEECEYTYIQIKAPNDIVVPITISELNGNVSLLSNVTPNINSTTGMIDLGEEPNLFIGGAVFSVDDMKNHRSIPIQTEGGYLQDSGRRKLWYNIKTGFFGTYNYNMALSDEEVLIGSISVEYSSTGAYKGILKDVNLPFNYTIDGKSIHDTIFGKIGIGFVPSAGNAAKIDLPNIDTQKKILDLGIDSVLLVGNEYYAFASLFPNNPEYYREIPIYEQGNDTGALRLVFNYESKRVYAIGATRQMKSSELVIGGIRLVYKTHEFLAASLPFNYTIDGKNPEHIESEKKLRLYSGERPNLPRYYNFKTLLSFSEVGEYDREIDSQGMDIYANKYLFQGSNPKASESTNYNNIYVIDLESKTLLGGFEYKKDSHVNTLNCGAKYADSDTYPLLYVSECYYEHGCDVIRLNNDLLSYQSIQRISYVGSQHFSGWTAYDWTIDLENSFIYAFGTNNGFTQILKFALPLPTSGNVEFTDDDILDVFSFSGAYIYQGAKIISNQMFIPFGYGNTQYPAYINVFDISRKEVVSHIPLDGFGETEAVALYKGNLVIVNNSTSPTYREIEL